MSIDAKKVPKQGKAKRDGVINQRYLGIEFYFFISHGGLNDRGSMCNFVMREALFEIDNWILCLSYLHDNKEIEFNHYI